MLSLTTLRVTQEPHKHQHFVMLLLALSRRSVSLLSEEPDAQVGEKRKAGGEDEAECGRDVLEDLSRAFRGWVEGREWLNMRLCVSALISEA
jgi:nuclear cap-binding protein subunit 1